MAGLGSVAGFECPKEATAWGTNDHGHPRIPAYLDAVRVYLPERTFPPQRLSQLLRRRSKATRDVGTQVGKVHFIEQVLSAVKHVKDCRSDVLMAFRRRRPRLRVTSDSLVRD